MDDIDSPETSPNGARTCRLHPGLGSPSNPSQRMKPLPLGMKPLVDPQLFPSQRSPSAASPARPHPIVPLLGTAGKPGIEGSPTKHSGINTARAKALREGAIYTPRGTNIIMPSRINRSGGAGVVHEVEAASVISHVSNKLAAHYDEQELARRSRELAAAEREERKEALETARRMETARASAAEAEPSVEAAPPAAPPRMQASPLLELSFTISGVSSDGGMADLLLSDSTGELRLNEPSCITALPDGNLCVADTKHHRLVILTPEGQPLAYLTEYDDGCTPSGTAGRKPLRQPLNLPRGIACDDTALYVAEVGGGSLRKLRLPPAYRSDGAATPRASHVSSTCVEGGASVNGQLTFPQGITQDGGELFACDCEDSRVVVYDAATLTYLRHFGGAGSGEGELSYPYSCCVVGPEVLVADVANNRVASFSRVTGKFIRAIGRMGDAPGCFHSPRAVAALRAPAAKKGIFGGLRLGPKLGMMPYQQLDGPAAGGGTGGGGGQHAILVDGAMAPLDASTHLAVCEKTRLQVLELNGTPLQLLALDGATDLWAIATVGRYTYVSDRGRNCIHVLSPPRPRSAKALAAAAAEGTAAREEEEEAEGPLSPTISHAQRCECLSPRAEASLERNSHADGGLTARITAARMDRVRASKAAGSAAAAALAEAEEAASAANARAAALAARSPSHIDRCRSPPTNHRDSPAHPLHSPTGQGGSDAPTTCREPSVTFRGDLEEQNERRAYGISRDRPERSSARRLSLPTDGSPAIPPPPPPPAPRGPQYATTDGAALSAALSGSSPSSGGGSSSASALSEAVRRIRTGASPSPPGKEGMGGMVAGKEATGGMVIEMPALSLPSGPMAQAVLPRLPRDEAGHACVLSPRVPPGGVSMRLGGKGAADKTTVKLTANHITRQRI